jgi:Glycosyltransferase family 92/D12 class N6 adenine-specific DNA methyltransferase
MCPLESQTRLPTSVSLVSNPCGKAKNNLKIINNQPPNGIKKEFGVCTKQMNFKNRDFAMRFIEWIEILRIFGVEKIHGYNRHVSKDLFKVMTYYEEKGFLEIKPFLEPFETAFIMDWPLRAIERNILNDCFYRNKNLYKYIAIIDPDEIIMPLRHENWHEMLSSLREADYFYFPYVSFANNLKIRKTDEAPSHLYMLQHIQVTMVTSFVKPKML